MTNSFLAPEPNEGHNLPVNNITSVKVNSNVI